MKYSLSLETLQLVGNYGHCNSNPCLASSGPVFPFNPQTPIDSACSAGAAPVEDAFPFPGSSH